MNRTLCPFCHSRPGAVRHGGFVAATCLLGLILTGLCRADQIVIGNTSFPGAKIVGYDQGRLLFRTADGALQDAWLSDVDLLVVDRGGTFIDFNQAERFLADDKADKAAARYRRTLRLAEGFWADIVASRLLIACDRAHDIRRATLGFIRVVRGAWSGPAAAVRLMPEALPASRDAAVVRAIAQLENAISVASSEEQRASLKLFRYEVLRRVGDRRTEAAARTIAVMPIAESLRCQRVYSVQLAALRSVLGDRADAAALESLDRAIRHCPEAILPSFLLLKGQALLRQASSREETIRAAWPFMRVAIHMPDDPRAAEGLYGAALAVERIGRTDRAIALLQECLVHERLSDDVRRKAEVALSRWRPRNAGSK